MFGWFKKKSYEEQIKGDMGDLFEIFMIFQPTGGWKKDFTDEEKTLLYPVAEFLKYFTYTNDKKQIIDPEDVPNELKYFSLAHAIYQRLSLYNEVHKIPLPTIFTMANHETETVKQAYETWQTLKELSR